MEDSSKVKINFMDLAGHVVELDSNFTYDEPDSNENEEEIQRREYLCVDTFLNENRESFETLLEKMDPLIPNKKIHKFIVKEGVGDDMNDYSHVTIHYNAYIENCVEAFDSTYVRGRPCRFTTSNGEVWPGLDIAVQSMKLNEISQFLIHPDYAYGKGCVRVPPDTTVLFVVELINILDTGAALEFKDLSEMERKMFVNVYKYCKALSEKGKEFFRQQQIDKAIKEYNISLTALEDSKVITEDDFKNQFDLKMRLLSNLLVCYVRKEQWNKGVKTGEKAVEFCKDEQIPCKILFNYGKCLRMKGNYEEAQKMLIKASVKSPRDVSIGTELTFLTNDMLKRKERQRDLGKALLK